MMNLFDENGTKIKSDLSQYDHLIEHKQFGRTKNISKRKNDDFVIKRNNVLT